MAELTERKWLAVLRVELDQDGTARCEVHERRQRVVDEGTDGEEVISSSDARMKMDVDAFEKAVGEQYAKALEQIEGLDAKLMDAEAAHAAELKALKETHATELKETVEDHAAEVEELKEFHATEVAARDADLETTQAALAKVKARR